MLAPALVFFLLLVCLLFPSPVLASSNNKLSRWTWPNQRTLVLVTGNVRGGLVAWESLRRHVLKPLGADLWVVVGVRSGYEQQTNSTYLLRLSQHHVFENEHEDWGVVLDQAMRGLNGTGHDTQYWDTLCTVLTGQKLWLGGLQRGRCVEMKARSASQLAMRWLVLRELHKTDRSGQLYLYKYSRFILTRTDYLYLCDFPEMSSLDPAWVWTQEVAKWGGYSDRVTVMSQQNVLDVLEWPVELTQNPAKWTLLYEKCGVDNFEKAWYCYIEHKRPNSVKFFPHPAVIVAHKNDVSTWSRPSRNDRFNGTFVQIKKPDELEVAVRVCGWAGVEELKQWVQSHSCNGIIYLDHVDASTCPGHNLNHAAARVPQKEAGTEAKQVPEVARLFVTVQFFDWFDVDTLNLANYVTALAREMGLPSNAIANPMKVNKTLQFTFKEVDDNLGKNSTIDPEDMLEIMKTKIKKSDFIAPELAGMRKVTGEDGTTPIQYVGKVVKKAGGLKNIALAIAAFALLLCICAKEWSCLK